MPQLIEGAAIKVVDPKAVENFDQMPAEEQVKVRQEMFEMQSQVADQILKSPKGWDILTEFSRLGQGKLLSTSAFVVPVLQSMDHIKATLPDATGFQKSFQNLVQDLQTSKKSFDAIAAQHKGKAGQPSDMELPQVFELSNQYNAEITKLETVVEPLILSLCEQLSAGGVVEIGLDDTQEVAQ